jgi:cytochrome c biogenesis protein CcdA
MFKLIVLGMMSAIVFGVVDAFNFMLVEDALASMWKRLGFTDEQTIDLLNSGLSSALSIFIALYIDVYFLSQFKTFKHPALDAIGVIVGTILVLTGIKIYNWIAGHTAKLTPIIVTLPRPVMHMTAHSSSS